MKFVAMRAAVPEEFDNFDLLPICRLRMGQDRVIPPFNNFGASAGNTGALMPVSKRIIARARNNSFFSP